MRRSIAWALLGVIVMSLVLLGAVTVVRTTTVVDLIRADQKAGQQRSKETNENTEIIKRLADRIESCTNPEGECFKQGQERTGKAVASINDVIIAAAACAQQGYDTAPEIRACVVRILNGPKGRR